MRRKSAFLYRVVLPVLLAVVVTVGMVAGFVIIATAKSDERALQRETLLASQVIAQEVEALAAHQDYNSNWDEAITALAEKDLDWLDGELATDLFGDGKFDRIYVLDPAAQPIYAMYGGGRTGPERFEADRPVVGPMVERLQAIDAAGALAAYDAGNLDAVPHVTELGLVDGRPAYIGATAIMSESGDEGLEQVPGRESFLVCIRFLDGALAKDFDGKYFIGAAAFAATAATEAERANLALKNAAGETIGWLSWTPDKPGTLILAETLPAMLGALAICALVLVVLLRSLKRTTAALEAGRADAEYRANHDVLTGLANRAYFNRQLEEALSHVPADGSSLALLALDLDRFKQVNDTMGHEAGDQLLREVGRRLTPLVSEKDTIARLGGDEFAVLQRGVHSTDQVGALSSRIINELSAPFVVTGRVAQIGVSIGVVIAPAAQAARDLTCKADLALYAAKASGRNTWRIFDPSMEQPAEPPADARVAKLPAAAA